jgi:hypothetical protein
MEEMVEVLFVVLATWTTIKFPVVGFESKVHVKVVSELKYSSQ